jgi:hypothetical protein
MDFVLVEHGYQLDLYLNGKHYGTECRDFGGDHSVEKLTLDLVKRLMKTVDEFRRDY